MPYTTGKSKSLDDITLEDVLKYPIWEWALDEEDKVEQDETWQRPIVGTNNVTDEMYNPTITLKVKDSELFASAEYDNDSRSLSAIAVWLNDEWKSLSDAPVKTPLVLVAIPSINGIQHVEFICNSLSGDSAKRK